MKPIKVDAANFHDHCIESITRFYRDINPGDGCSRSEIDQAAAKTNCAIPAVLVRYFIALGNAKDLNHAYYRIFSPSELEARSADGDTSLLIATSSQDISSFAISTSKLKNEDPPVIEIFEDGKQIAFRNASSFYCFIVLWQLINELVPYRATCYISDSDARKIKKDAAKVIFSKSNTGDLEFYREDGCLLLLTTEERKLLLTVGGKEEKIVSDWCERYKLDVLELRKHRPKTY